MSAAELRQAAETLRARARAVNQHADEHGETTGGSRSWYTPVFIGEAVRKHAPLPDDDVVADHSTLVGAYIATMHPGVGLALADWLDKEARIGSGNWRPCDDPALSVARLVNGSAS